MHVWVAVLAAILHNGVLYNTTGIYNLHPVLDHSLRQRDWYLEQWYVKVIPSADGFDIRRSRDLLPPSSSSTGDLLRCGLF